MQFMFWAALDKFTKLKAFPTKEKNKYTKYIISSSHAFISLGYKLYKQ